MKDKLFRFALRLLQDVQEAEDAVQDVMVKIWSRQGEWGKWQSLEAYCMTATRNDCLDRLRRKKAVFVEADKVQDVGSTERDPYERMTGKETYERIRRCMDDLPENQQLVVQLREIEGFSYLEISEVLQMSIDQVKVNLFRARNAIKKTILKEEGLCNNQ